MEKQTNENTMLKLGQKIRIERLKRKMSQEELAEMADLNRNFVGMIERGETNITIKKLEGIANAFGVNIADLFIFTI